jgi:polyhydroxybutyrate depolymerase
MPTRRHVLLSFAALPACGLPTVSREAPGVHGLSDRIRGIQRHSLLFVPEGLTHEGPMLVALHDTGGTPKAELARWRAICAAEGWVGLFPDYPKEGLQDDNTNLTHVVQRATAMGGVDPRRRFVAGHGSGGRRAYALAASHSGLLAAVATSGAVLSFTAGSESPQPPGVSVLHLHGAQDDVVPLLGGPLPGDAKGRSILPVAEALRPWIQLAEAPDVPAVEGPRSRWAGPIHTVELLVDPNGGHDHSDAHTEAMRTFFRART